MSHEPSPLAGRYRYLRRVEAARNAVVWFAVDEDTEAPVVATLLAAPRAHAFTRSIGVTDPHLAAVLEIVREPEAAEMPPGVSHRGSSVVVAEHVAGEALYGVLRSGALRRTEAVRCVMGLASALAALHRRSAVHGAVSPLSVIHGRDDGGATPILTQLLMPSLGAFASPERAQNGGTSELDDVWALHATLYAALTGSAPVRVEGNKGRLVVELKPMGHFGYPDDILDGVIARGLNKSVKERTRAAEQLEADLVVWLTRNAQKRNVSLPPPPKITSLERPSDTADLERSSVQGELAETGPLAMLTPASIPPVEISSQGISSRSPQPVPRDPSEIVDEPPSDEPSERPDPEAIRAIIRASILKKREAERAAAIARGEEPPAPTPTPAAAAAVEAPAEAAATPEKAAADPAPAAPEPASKPDAAEPAPGPAIAAPAIAASPGPSRSILWVGLVAALVGAVTVLVVAQTRGRSEASAASPPESAAIPAPPPPTASAPRQPIAAATASAVKTTASASAADPSACMVGYFPAGTFSSPQDLSFICGPGDARNMAKTLYTRIVAAGGNGSTPGMREWATLDWYELAALAVLRGGCCPSAPPIELPQSPPPCDPLGPALDKLSAAVRAKDSVELRVLGFDKTAACLMSQPDRPYRYTNHPYSGGQNTFAGLLKRNGL